MPRSSAVQTRDHDDRQARDHDDRERDNEVNELFEVRRAAPAEADRIAARDRILELHLDLCDALANRYARRGIDRDDLVQVARIGLLYAIDRYQPSRGTFVGFAVPTITGELKRYFRDHGWAVRPPRSMQELRQRFLDAENEAVQQGQATPADSELLESLQVDQRTLGECRNLNAAYSPLSLDVRVGEGADDLASHLGMLDHEVEMLPVWMSLQRAVARLGERDHSILHWRFVEECTQHEIAERLGVSQMQVSRILTQIIAKLRDMLDVSPLRIAS